MEQNKVIVDCCDLLEDTGPVHVDIIVAGWKKYFFRMKLVEILLKLLVVVSPHPVKTTFQFGNEKED